jgi:hypothetical protein
MTINNSIREMQSVREGNKNKLLKKIYRLLEYYKINVGSIDGFH